MIDFYIELNLAKNSSLDEINQELTRLESTWKRREITNPEKATTMLALIIQARHKFSSAASRSKYDRELADSMKEQVDIDPESERRENLSKWIDQAQSYYSSQQYDLAKTAINNAFRFSGNDDDDSMYCLASNIYRKNGELETAMDYINRAIVASPDVPSYYLYNGVLLFAKGI